MNGHKVAVIGSGPSGVTAAGELAKIYCSEEAPRFVNGVLAKLA